MMEIIETFSCKGPANMPPTFEPDSGSSPAGLSPEAVLFLSHVHQRHGATFNAQGLPAEYHAASESEFTQLQTLAGAVDVSWLGLTLAQEAPTSVEKRLNGLAVPDRWPDGFFRHTIPEGRWIQIGFSDKSKINVTLEACMLQIIGPEWLELLDNLWIDPVDREQITSPEAAEAAIAGHLIGIPLLYIANGLIPENAQSLPTTTPALPGCGLIVSHDHAEVLWETLMSAGLSTGLNPVGVDARKRYYESFSG